MNRRGDKAETTMAGKIMKYLLKPTSFAIVTNNKSTIQTKTSAPNPMALTVTKESKEEPTSPRVSCMGRVSRHKKDKSKKKEKKTKKSSKQHKPSTLNEKDGVDDDDDYNQWCKAKKLIRVQGRQTGEVVLMIEAEVEKRKEVNLWKRRTHVPPTRLEVPT